MERPMILVVEDEAIVAKTLERRLQSLGYGVVGSALSGEEAIRTCKDKNPDLVLMDIGLQGDMDGIDAAEIIKDEYHIPVIYLTAYSDEKTLERAKITEPFGYLLKPFEVLDLKSAIEMALYKAKVDVKLKESEKRYRTLFERSSDAISILDMHGTVLDVNESSILMFEAKGSEDLVGKEFIDFFEDKDVKKAKHDLELVRKEGSIKREYTFAVISGKIKTIETAVTLMADPKGEPIGLVTISRDITSRKEMEKDIKRKLMKYQLQEGSVYMVQEPDPNISKEAFKDLLKLGFKGLFISRTPSNKVKGFGKQEFEHWWLSESEKDKGTSPKMNDLKKLIEGVDRDSVVLLDRLDYIYEKNDFKKTLALVNHLTEIAYLKDLIVLISLDPNLFSGKELKKLEKEVLDIEPVFRGKLPDELISLLRLVFEENVVGVKPTYSFIGAELKISKPTTRKRISRLVSAGFLRETTSGRTKVLELTGKGRNLFER